MKEGIQMKTKPIYQIVIKETQRKEIQRLFFDLRQLTGNLNGDILIEALESLNSKHEG